MAILLKCSTRKHTLRLKPAHYWKKTLCPECGPVDPARLRRLSRLPRLLFDKEIQVIPQFVKEKVIPVLGLIALSIGIWLTATSKHQNEAVVVANTSTTESYPTPVVPAASPISSLPTAQNKSTPQTIQLASIPSPAAPNSNSPESTPPPPTTVRYPTGTNLEPPSKLSGKGWLRISNGTGDDAIAKLVESTTGKTCRRVYIQAGDTTKIERIGSGTYILKFSLGSGYDSSEGRFTGHASFSKFDEILDYTVQRNGNGVEWFNHEVTLNPVVGGTARTSSISAEDFNDQ